MKLVYVLPLLLVLVVGVNEVYGETQNDDESSFDYVPIIIAIIGMFAAFMGGVRTARQKGIEISIAAEEKLFQTTKSLVQTQRRDIFKKLSREMEFQDSFEKGLTPEKLLKTANNNVKKDLQMELQSSKFTKISQWTIEASLDSLIDRAVTETKKEWTERRRKLLKEITPMVLGSEVLSYNTVEEIKTNKENIINGAKNSLREFFNDEQVLISSNMLEISIKYELENKLQDWNNKYHESKITSHEWITNEE